MGRLKTELEFFQTWWKILRKYWNPPAKRNQSKQANDFWNGLCDECRALHKKYESNTLFEPFARKMCLDLISEIERRSIELHKEER